MLADRLDFLIGELKRKKQNGDDILKKIPAWILGWQSPWKGKEKGGELVGKGEDELYNLGTRVRERFKDLFAVEYHPDIFTIKATQVSNFLCILFF